MQVRLMYAVITVLDSFLSREVRCTLWRTFTLVLNKELNCALRATLNVLRVAHIVFGMLEFEPRPMHREQKPKMSQTPSELILATSDSDEKEKALRQGEFMVKTVKTKIDQSAFPRRESWV